MSLDSASAAEVALEPAAEISVDWETSRLAAMEMSDDSSRTALAIELRATESAPPPDAADTALESAVLMRVDWEIAELVAAEKSDDSVRAALAAMLRATESAPPAPPDFHVPSAPSTSPAAISAAEGPGTRPSRSCENG